MRRARALYRGIEPNTPEANDLFRHNEQSVRIVRLLEKEGQGLNLTLEVMDGMCCHTGPLRAFTPEGRIVARADRIAYITHDIDDAERAGLLSEADLPEEAREVLGCSASQRIETMIQDVVATSAQEGDIAMSERVWHAASRLRAFLYENLYEQGDAKSEEPKAERVLGELFTYYVNHMDEVPNEYKLHNDAPDVQVCDYLASMTDRYAIRVYEELNVPKGWSLR